MKGRPTPLVEMLLTTATSHSRLQLQVERSALCGLVGAIPYSGLNSWELLLPSFQQTLMKGFWHCCHDDLQNLSPRQHVRMLFISDLQE